MAVNRSTDADAQFYTDQEDSAAYVRYSSGVYYIADHNTQGFAGLSSAKVGDVAYLFTGAGIEAFSCTNSFTGHNTGTGLVDEGGHDLESQMPTCGFTAYTCLDSWTNIHVTFWERTWIASTTSSQPTVRLTRQDAGSTPMESGESQRSSRPEKNMRESIATPGTPAGSIEAVGQTNENGMGMPAQMQEQSGTEWMQPSLPTNTQQFGQPAQGQPQQGQLNGGPNGEQSVGGQPSGQSIGVQGGGQSVGALFGGTERPSQGPA